MPERWSDLADRPGDRGRRGPDPLEQGLDRLVTAGRQLVDGVSGARPGSRPPVRSAAGAAPERPRLGNLGRWVEDKLDWILEDDDDWREPWQQQPRPPSRPQLRPESRPEPQPPAGHGGGGRRPLEAISRRGQRPASAASAPAAAQAPADTEEWPEEESFTRPRWQRPVVGQVRNSEPAPGLPPAAGLPPAMAPGGRPLPRSSRRRQP